MAKTKPLNLRSLACFELQQLLSHGKSLTAFHHPALSARDNAFVSELCFGVARFYYRLEAIAALLLEKPLAKRELDVLLLLLIGLYQLDHTRVPTHAALFETVAACPKKWAKGLLNACLRHYLRRRTELQSQLQQQTAYVLSSPAWLIHSLETAFGETETKRLLELNHQTAPMSLRLDTKRLARSDYLAKLAQNATLAQEHPWIETAVVLETPVPVEQLPFFQEGLVSVQDPSSQLATFLLDPKPGEKVLDACAAPGAKTGHLWQHAQGAIELIAVEERPIRVQKLEQTFKRLQIQGTIHTALAQTLVEHYPPHHFDKILLDAPCSGTGVIRRHPDIMLNRTPKQLLALQQTQQQLLVALWPLLAPGGRLLYSTCSLLPQENEEQLHHFLKSHSDAIIIPLHFHFGTTLTIGLQIPTQTQMDGFYYALLEKSSP